MTNLSIYTIPQLKQLTARIEKEIAKRESVTKSDLLKKLTKLAKESGLSLDDVLGNATPAPAKARKVSPKGTATRKEPLPIKYRHPSNRDLAWSGRGRRPQWVEAWLAQGGAMSALEIAAQKMEKRSMKQATEAQPVVQEPPAEVAAG
ncbi:H-NS histone family protein [Aromatoleum evansii]|uniref:H-NS histone family protein n=1 Tax=Aromatoleum evansii TaxID=59406 RepID=A0ABZ1AV54_AROEV|nr:H-NS histone family protein [Aromatoleum evansii]